MSKCVGDNQEYSGGSDDNQDQESADKPGGLALLLGSWLGNSEEVDKSSSKCSKQTHSLPRSDLSQRCRDIRAGCHL
jgi:hypothetical protein